MEDSTRNREEFWVIFGLEPVESLIEQRQTESALVSRGGRCYEVYVGEEY